jgi:GT2 family glycosyltransferase
VASQVEVCIVSYASAAHLAECLSSVTSVMGGDTPVAVREHHPDALDATRTVLDSSSLPTRLEHDRSNPGFGAGCNALAATSTADWLLFLNADARIVSWPFEAMPAPAIIGPMMVDSGHPGRHYGLSYRVRDEIRRSWLRRYDGPPAGTGFVSGAALLIPRATFLEVGGFDARYFMYYEDIDLCLRANQRGVPTFVEPAWTVRHQGGHSTSQDSGLALQRSLSSALHFHRAHGHPVVAFRMYVVVDSLVRAAFHLIRGRHDKAGAYVRLLSVVARRPESQLISR